jgi:nicotinamide riboside kinase
VEDYDEVGRKQDQAIHEAIQKPSKFVIVDTDALITQFYLEEYLKTTSNYLDELINQQNWDIIFFLSQKNTKWIDDGIRVYENQRDEKEKVIIKMLEKHNKTFMLIENVNGYEAREAQVIEVIKKMFKL